MLCGREARGTTRGPAVIEDRDYASSLAASLLRPSGVCLSGCALCFSALSLRRRRGLEVGIAVIRRGLIECLAGRVHRIIMHRPGVSLSCGVPTRKITTRGSGQSPWLAVGARAKYEGFRSVQSCETAVFLPILSPAHR